RHIRSQIPHLPYSRATIDGFRSWHTSCLTRSPLERRWTMLENTNSPLFWIGLGVVVVGIAVMIDYIRPAVVTRLRGDMHRHSHLIATQLPRVLHKADHDEVLALKDEAEMLSKS